MAKLSRLIQSNAPEIWEAVDGNIDLRHTNQKLYKKIHNSYKNSGVVFTGDSDLDYNLVIRYLGDESY